MNKELITQLKKTYEMLMKEFKHKPTPVLKNALDSITYVIQEQSK